MCIIDQFLHLSVGLVYVLGITRQCAPTKRANPPTKQRTDICWHKAWKAKRRLQPFFGCDLPDVVAVIKRWHAIIPKINHRRHMRFHRCSSRGLDFFWLSLLFCSPFSNVPSKRQIAVKRIMRRCLVRNNIRLNPPPHKLGEHISSIANQRNRLGLTRITPALYHVQRLVKRMGLLIDIAGPKPGIGTGLITFNSQTTRASHHRGKWLGTAHAAKTRSQNPAPSQITIIMLATSLNKRFICALHNALRPNVNP